MDISITKYKQSLANVASKVEEEWSINILVELAMKRKEQLENLIHKVLFSLEIK